VAAARGPSKRRASLKFKNSVMSKYPSACELCGEGRVTYCSTGVQTR